MIVTLTDDLNALVRAQAAAVGMIEDKVQASVTREALGLKRAWVGEARGHAHLPHLPSAVVVEDIIKGKAVSFGDGAQGQLAHIAAFGSATSGPVMDPFRHVDPVATRLAQWVGEIGEQTL